MADDANDVSAGDISNEITLDDFNADEQQPAKAEPSPAPKEEKAEVEETKDSEGDDTPAAPDVPLKTETEDQPVEETETENKPPGVPEEAKTPKAVNRWQQLSNENKELREQVEKLTSETYAPQSVQELTEIVNPETGQAYTVAEATDIALNQQLQMRDYNTRATNAQALLGAEAYEVMQELPIFNPDSGPDVYDEELSMLAAATLEANLVRDPNIPEIGPDGQPTGRGMIVDYHQTPKQIYQTLARASGISAMKGEIKGQANTEKQLANVDAASNAAPPKAKSDPLMDLWKSDD